MGRRSINTTKSGKYMNPTDQARKEARKKELKKNKRQRQMVRAAVLKNKDPGQILEEMEKIDEMEYNVLQPSPLNEKVLRDKRKKLKETFERVMRLYHNDEPEHWLALKIKEGEYEKQRLKKQQYYESVKHAQCVQVDEIPLPAPAPLGSGLSVGFQSVIRVPPPPITLALPPFAPSAPPNFTKKSGDNGESKSSDNISQDKDMRESGCERECELIGVPPGPPPNLFEMSDLDTDAENDEVILKRYSPEGKSPSRKSETTPNSLQQRMLAISGQNIDEFMKEMENVHKKKQANTKSGSDIDDNVDSNKDIDALDTNVECGGNDSAIKVTASNSDDTDTDTDNNEDNNKNDCDDVSDTKSLQSSNSSESYDDNEEDSSNSDSEMIQSGKLHGDDSDSDDQHSFSTKTSTITPTSGAVSKVGSNTTPAATSLPSQPVITPTLALPNPSQTIHPVPGPGGALPQRPMVPPSPMQLSNRGVPPMRGIVPPPSMLFRPPPMRPPGPGMSNFNMRMPPGPPPHGPRSHSIGGMSSRMGMRMPPGPPPGMPPRMPHHLKQSHVHSNHPQQQQQQQQQLPTMSHGKDQSKGITTISAKPQIRNLSADVTRFVPSTLRIKRDETKKPQRPKLYAEEHEQQHISHVHAHATEVKKTTTKDDAYMQFMNEMQELL